MQHEETVERLRLDRLKTGIKLKLYEYPVVLLSVVRQTFRVWDEAQIDQAVAELKDEGFLIVNTVKGVTRLGRIVS